MMAVGLDVFITAIKSMFQASEQAPDLTSVWTGLFCAVVMYVVYRYNKNLAQKIKKSSRYGCSKR